MQQTAPRAATLPPLQSARKRPMLATTAIPVARATRERSFKCQADGSRTLEPAPAADTARSALAAAAGRLESALESYKYVRAEEPTAVQGTVAAMQQRLDAIGRELVAANPEEHARLSGAQHTAASFVGASPLLQALGAPQQPAVASAVTVVQPLAEQQLAPPPQQQQNSIVPLKLRQLIDGATGAKQREVPRPEGSGEEILLQGFNWDSWKQPGGWYNHLNSQAEEIAGMGFTTIWLPPFTQSVSPEGYMPGDLYNLNSKYGSEADLLRCIAALQKQGLKVLGDAVLNHRCAQHQDETGTWNKYGGQLAWDQRAIVGDDPHFRGRGNRSSGDLFAAAPNIDHSQEFVKKDLSEWLVWLRNHAGFDGWRLDFVKGFHGSHVKDYMEASAPAFAVGEFWDALEYGWDGAPTHNQDAHRQRTINWINAAGGLATAFDITTKGIMHAVFERCEYWRLRDDKGKPPGLLGWWPSRAVTFLENHDTGSSQGHWRFPGHALEQGYAYILTHPGTPTVFYDHLFHNNHLRHVVQRLMALRKRSGIHCRSEVKILRAERDVYAAQIDGKLILKIGPGDFTPDPSQFKIVENGHAWCVWAKQ